jgi:hypothetical protein
MYKLTILNEFGQFSVIEDEDLDRLKLIATRMNENGCSVEITKEVVLFRIVDIND